MFFQSQHTLVPAGDIQFIYMNQIAGPTHQEWRFEPSTFNHLGDVQVKETSFNFYVRRNYHAILTQYLGDQWSDFAHHYREEGRIVAPI